MCESELMMVAVKKLKENASESDHVMFLQEAAIMGQFWHPNVVALHGVVTVGEPVSFSLTIHSHHVQSHLVYVHEVPDSTGVLSQQGLVEVLEECENYQVSHNGCYILHI